MSENELLKLLENILREASKTSFDREIHSSYRILLEKYPGIPQEGEINRAQEVSNDVLTLSSMCLLDPEKKKISY